MRILRRMQPSNWHSKISQQNGGLWQISQVQTLNQNGQLADTLELRGRSPLVLNGTTVPNMTGSSPCRAAMGTFTTSCSLHRNGTSHSSGQRLWP